MKKKTTPDYEMYDAILPVFTKYMRDELVAEQKIKDRIIAAYSYADKKVNESFSGNELVSEEMDDVRADAEAYYEMVYSREVYAKR